MTKYTPLFEWDDNKDTINQRKHNVDFDRASTVFLDPFCIIIEDTQVTAYEPRYLAIGQTSNNVAVLMVVHTYRDDEENEIIRIISARKLSKNEVKKYGYR